MREMIWKCLEWLKDQEQCLSYIGRRKIQHKGEERWGIKNYQGMSNKKLQFLN